MKKAILVIAVCMTILLAAFVFAADQERERARNETNESSGIGAAVQAAKAAGNWTTYGQCVSENADVKNTCYSNVKSTYKGCNDAAKNSTDARTAKKQCSSTYKKDMADCKKVFKDAKNECKKIKHSFMETLRYSMA